ncbi:MAG: hypothetical protein QOH60_1529, partial [Mycobacterium sp.]|nr:hypothetical protein [Mycobacterium sp.]
LWAILVALEWVSHVCVSFLIVDGSTVCAPDTFTIYRNVSRCNHWPPYLASARMSDADVAKRRPARTDGAARRPLRQAMYCHREVGDLDTPRRRAK